MGAPEVALLGLLLASPGGPAAAPPRPVSPVVSPRATAPARPVPTAPEPAAPPAPTAPQPPLLSTPAPSPPSGYELRPAKDGKDTLVYEGPFFTARVAVDGTVTFGAKRSTTLSWWWPPYFPVPVDNGRPSLQATITSALRGKKQPKVESDKVVDESFLIIPYVTRYRPDTREGTRTTFDALPIWGISGRGDLTDALLGLSQGEPHRIEKARFLTATRDLRIHRAVRAHAAWIREATASLPQRLETIAADDRVTLAERRAILEALADEMDDSPAGRAAAAQIRGFVAKRFAARNDASVD